ncbi:nitrite reductase small subunit NirD [Microbacteriaceae bacterium VKM Ac-2855]|nr:nitrite reductase small subunit NirD [Microbacteriaceae bacterium VKM Ac-2855]
MTILENPGTALHSAPGLTWHPVCSSDELETLWGEAALIDGAQIALFLLPEGHVRVVSNIDPATGAAVMSRGIVGSRRVEGVDRPTIASPLHKDVFDLETGACYTKSSLLLPTWASRERDGMIEVSRRTALIAASHGTSDEGGRRAVAALVAAVRAVDPTIHVLDSFVDVQQPDVPSVLDTLAPGQPAAIVPLLLSAGYHVHVDLAEAAGEADRPVRVTGALGPDARLATILARRLAQAGLRDGDSVVLAAAGSSDASAVADCHTMGELLAAELDREVIVSFISAAHPRVSEAVARARTLHPGDRVVVATYLLAPGYFAGLAEEAGADVTSAPLLLDPSARSTDATPTELVAIVSELYSRL